MLEAAPRGRRCMPAAPPPAPRTDRVAATGTGRSRHPGPSPMASGTTPTFMPATYNPGARYRAWKHQLPRRKQDNCQRAKDSLANRECRSRYQRSGSKAGTPAFMPSMMRGAFTPSRRHPGEADPAHCARHPAPVAPCFPHRSTGSRALPGIPVPSNRHGAYA